MCQWFILITTVLMDEVLFLAMYREYFDGSVRGKPSAFFAKVETAIDEKKVEAKVRQRILAELAQASQVPDLGELAQAVDMETGSTTINHHHHIKLIFIKLIFIFTQETGS